MELIWTESTNVNTNSVERILAKVEKEIKAGGRAIVMDECFDINYDHDLDDFMMLRAFYRMLKYCLANDWCLSDEALEKMNLYLIRR